MRQEKVQVHGFGRRTKQLRFGNNYDDGQDQFWLTFRRNWGQRRVPDTCRSFMNMNCRYIARFIDSSGILPITCENSERTSQHVERIGCKIEKNCVQNLVRIHQTQTLTRNCYIRRARASWSNPIGGEICTASETRVGTWGSTRGPIWLWWNEKKTLT